MPTEIRLFDDRRALGIRLDTKKSAQQVERLLTLIAAYRAAMLPEVPGTLPEATEPDPNAAQRRIDNPAANLVAKDDGSLDLHLRHPGFGWLTFHIPLREAQGFSELLFRQFGPPDEPGAAGPQQ